MNGVVWNPYRGQKGASEFDFITFGVKHINFWNYGSLQRALSKTTSVTPTARIYREIACVIPPQPDFQGDS